MLAAARRSARRPPPPGAASLHAGTHVLWRIAADTYPRTRRRPEVHDLRCRRSATSRNDALEQRLFELATDALVVTTHRRRRSAGRIRRGAPCSAGREAEALGRLAVGRRASRGRRPRARTSSSTLATDGRSRVEQFRCRIVPARRRGALGRGRAPSSTRPPASATSSRATSPARRGRRRAARARPSATRRPAWRSSAPTAASAASTAALCRHARPRRGRAARAQRAATSPRTATRAERWARAAVGATAPPGLVRARGAPAHRRRPRRRRARQRHARARPARATRSTTSSSTIDVTERIAAQDGAGRQRGQARRGPAGRAARQLGVARSRRTASPGPTSSTGSTACAPRPTRRAGRHHLERVHPDDRARVARTIEQGVADGRAWNLDHRILRPDGDVRLSTRAARSRRRRGRTPSSVHGTCQDVTESRRVEDALRAAEQLFRRAFDDAPIGMALIDLEGRWLRLNRAIAQMAGRTEADCARRRSARSAIPTTSSSTARWSASCSPAAAAATRSRSA